MLSGNFLDTTFNVETPVLLFHAGHEERSVCEEVVHLLKRALSGLRQEAIEENGVGGVADLWDKLASNPVFGIADVLTVNSR
jgi:hypothetical protein